MKLREATIDGSRGTGTSKYSRHYPDVVYKLARGGLTLSEMAKKIGVTDRTLSNWKRAYPEFGEAILAGRDVACSNVESALYVRAIGFTKKIYKDVINPEKKKSPENDVAATLSVLTEVYFPPDERAIEFFLTNRKPNEWSHRAEIKLTDAEKAAASIEKRKAELLESAQIVPLDVNPLDL